MHGIVISIREASLVVRQRDEAVLQVLKFTAFLSAGRTLDEFAALGCFRAILLRFEHAEPFSLSLRAFRPISMVDRDKHGYRDQRYLACGITLFFVLLNL